MPGSTFVGGSIDIHVRFEALGGNARRAQIFRRHEDLQRAYEHQVKGFARETRHVTSKLSRKQSEHLSRMKAIQKLEPQSFREEWPPIEERRAIIAQMQDGVPLFIGASLSKHASSSKGKDVTSTKQLSENHKNKSIPPKTRPVAPKKDRSKATSITQSLPVVNNDVKDIATLKTNTFHSKLNERLSRPHFAQPKSLSDPSLGCKRVQTTETKTHSSETRKHSTWNSSKSQQPASKELTAPVIILSPADPDAAHSKDTPSSQQGISNSIGQTSGSVLKPAVSSAYARQNFRGDNSPSSNREPRRRWRSRNAWGKHESVLLFKVEAREGVETYTQVAQRKYPSHI